MSKPLDRETLDELLRLEREATAGPWHVGICSLDKARIIMGPDEGEMSGRCIADVRCGWFEMTDKGPRLERDSDVIGHANAVLIPAMRNALVSLVELAGEGLAARERITLADTMLANWQFNIEQNHLTTRGELLTVVKHIRQTLTREGPTDDDAR